MSLNKHKDGVTVDAESFDLFRSFLQEAAGIQLDANKQYLVETRIRRILIDYKIDCVSKLIERVKLNEHRELRQKVIDAMTTNETFWFRDSYPFEFMRNHILPEFSKHSPNGTLRIWSAACSSGQEPYSTSMIVSEYQKGIRGKDVDVEIIATDLSNEIMEQAKTGEYDRLSVSRGLSSTRLRDNFDEVNAETWRLKPQIKNRIRFRPQNLKSSYIMLGKFQVVFCRNVLIYFSSELKQDIIRRIHRTMEPGGYLFLGSSESLGEASGLFEMVHCSPGVVYKAK